MRALIIAILSFVLFSSVCAKELDRIIARVNKEVITSRDLGDYCKAVAYRLHGSDEKVACDNDQEKGVALLSLINDKLILDKAKGEDMDVPSSWINSKLNQIIASYPSREEFDQSLIDRGFNVTMLKKKIKEQYLVKQTIEKYVRSWISVSPREVTDYYESHLNEFRSPQTYILWIVMSEEKRVADKVHRAAKSKGIDHVKKEFSEIIINIESNPQELKEQISEVVLTLDEKDSVVANIDDTYHFIYLEEILPSHEIPLGEVQEKVYAIISDQKFRKKFAEWIKTLQDEAVIIVYQ